MLGRIRGSSRPVEVQQQIVMIGPALDSQGGMASVAATYRDAGLFERCKLRYLVTYRHPGWADKLRCLTVSWLTLAAMLLRRQVSLLHAHTASRGSFWRKSLFVALARLFGVPVVLHVHSGEFVHFYEGECGRMRKALVRSVMRASTLVLCLTPRWQGALAVIEPRADIRVLPNPVMAQPDVLARRAAGSVQPGCVLFLGRLREKKGVFDLLRAWPDVLARVPGARLVLAGDGDVQAIEKQARELGIERSIALPGWVTGAVKLDWLARAAVFVLPSHAEGLPIGVIEAMACGVPVLATRVGGVPDVLEDGRLGCLVEAGDVSALSSSLSALLAGDSTTPAHAALAVERVQEVYEARTVVDRLTRLWQECLRVG